MPKCEDCDSPVVWLRKPDGGWLPPVEPLFDFAYNDHYIATVDGIAQSVPQVYKRHECLTWEQKQLKLLEREQEKRRLIEEDRARRAEEARIQQELDEARRQAAKEAERAQRALDARLEREERQREQERLEKEAVRVLRMKANSFPERLIAFDCEECGAHVGEPCRNLTYFDQDRHVHLWWTELAHASRYNQAPPDDRSKIHHAERWGPEYAGPWPPDLRNQESAAGAYEMRAWLQQNYLYVFEPEKVWLTQAEESTLTDWLAEYGDIFQEVSDEPEGLADDEGRLAGDGGTGGGHAGRDARSAEGRDDPVDPE